MSRISILIKYFVKNSLEEMFGGKNKGKTILMAFIVLFVVILLSVPFAVMVSSSYGSLAAIGQGKLLISLILLFSISVTFFFGIFSIMNTFYFSNDIEYLLPLPFKGDEIVFGKFISVIISILLYAAIGILPLVAYGIQSNAGILYYVYMIIIILTIPIFPMIIATSICVILMRFTNFSKHKDAFKMIGGCLSLVLIVAFNIFSQSSKGSDSSAIIKMLSDGGNSLVSRISGIFITNKFATFALDKSSSISGFGYLLCTILISICIFIIFYIIIGKIYLRSIIGNIESYGKRKSISEVKDNINTFIQKSPMNALVIRDIKVVFRTPQFFINSIAMLIYMPIIVGVSIFMNHDNQSLVRFLNRCGFSGTLFGIVFVATALFISSGGAATYAVSREGKDFTISKYIPVSYVEHLHSKIISSICMNQIDTLIVAIMLLILKVNLILVIFSVLIAAATVTTITFFGLFLDFRFPKLEWEDEKAMMKNNFVPLLIMLIMLGLGGLLIILSLFVNSAVVMFIIIFAVCFVICYIFYNLLLKLAKKLYENE